VVMKFVGPYAYHLQLYAVKMVMMQCCYYSWDVIYLVIVESLPVTLSL